MVVGPGEELRTATDRISMLSMDDLAGTSGKESDELSPLDVQAAHDKAFDVERVTKEFFREYASIFARVEGLVEGIVDPERKRLFTQRLFNRLMFLAFYLNEFYVKADKPDLDLTALDELEARIDVAYTEGDMFALRIAVMVWVKAGVDLFGRQQAKKGAA